MRHNLRDILRDDKSTKRTISPAVNTVQNVASSFAEPVGLIPDDRRGSVSNPPLLSSDSLEKHKDDVDVNDNSQSTSFRDSLPPKEIFRANFSKLETDRFFQAHVPHVPDVNRRLQDLDYRTNKFSSSLGSFTQVLEKNKFADMTVPEIHFIGQILGGVGFNPGIFCKFRIESGKNWTLLAGNDFGQTQISYSEDNELSPWNHPIDILYATKSMQGWPRIIFQLWNLDDFGLVVPAGYGFCHLPNVAGSTEIVLPCWQIVGNVKQEIAAFFLGTKMQLQNCSAIFDMAWDQRTRLVSEPSGTVIMHLNVLFKEMAQFNVNN